MKQFCFEIIQLKNEIISIFKWALIIFFKVRGLPDAHCAQLVDANASDEVSKLMVMLEYDATVADPSGLLMISYCPFLVYICGLCYLIRLTLRILTH